jgi:hypothetical protein
MPTFKQAFNKHESNRLIEARVSLLQKGVYPFDVFLKESSEAVHAAEKIEQLEEVANRFKNHVPTLHMFVQQNSSVLLEGKAKPAAIKAAMINYTFVCESLNKCVNEAVKLMSAKVPANKSLYAVYNKDAVQLLEFCVKKSQAYKLMEGNVDPVVKTLSTELANLPLRDLKVLCESVPAMRLYVSNETYNQLTQTVLGG